MGWHGREKGEKFREWKTESGVQVSPLRLQAPPSTACDWTWHRALHKTGTQQTSVGVHDYSC